MNLMQGETHFLTNAISALSTALIGIVMSIVGLLVFIYLKGGDAYLRTLSEAYILGGDLSVPVYCITLLFEGVASAVIVTLVMMMLTNSKYLAD